MDRVSDQSLILALRAGDREAFRLVYERYRGDVLALLAVMSPSSERTSPGHEVLHQR